MKNGLKDREKGDLEATFELYLVSSTMSIYYCKRMLFLLRLAYHK